MPFKSKEDRLRYQRKYYLTHVKGKKNCLFCGRPCGNYTRFCRECGAKIGAVKTIWKRFHQGEECSTHYFLLSDDGTFGFCKYCGKEKVFPRVEVSEWTLENLGKKWNKNATTPI